MSAVRSWCARSRAGAWQTEGFPESLNDDPTQTAPAPSIDFTGANRTVPWVGWAEPCTALGGVSQIFASRFASQPPPAQNGGQWIHEGQDARVEPCPRSTSTPSRDATDPSLIGGTTTAGANPAPWITWQEADNGSQAVRPATPPTPTWRATRASRSSSLTRSRPRAGCARRARSRQAAARGRASATSASSRWGSPGAGPSSGQFDPSLNVDPTRDGIQADIAFTGANDSVPWVVWYENSDNGRTTLRSSERRHGVRRSRGRRTRTATAAFTGRWWGSGPRARPRPTTCSTPARRVTVRSASARRAPPPSRRAR